MGNKSSRAQAVQRPKVGIQIIVLNKESKILTGTRVQTGTCGLPGGSLEWGEKVKDFASRRLYAETMIRIKPEDFRALEVLNFPHDTQHRIDWILACRYPDDHEPDTRIILDWYSLEELPKLDLYHELRTCIEREKMIVKVNYENLDEMPEIQTE